MRIRALINSERGVSLVMTALTLVLLLGASAIAVDLAALRTDRSADQKVTDSAASAGALAAIEGGAGQEACEAALAYIAVNSEEISSIDATGCAASFSASCDPAVVESHTVTTGRFTATIVYPVPDNHALMTSGLLGAPTQTVVAEDGDPCERVGVEVSAERQGLFAQVLGWDQGTTTVHTVAAAGLPTGEEVPLNLLVLDRTGCQAIWVQGSPGAGVIVKAVVNEDGTGLIQGVAASDSDASAGCSSDGVIDVDGSNAVLRADGPEGCANQTGTGTVDGFTSGNGCGLIQTLVPPGLGCVLPACSGHNGGNPHPNPDPTALPARLTRAPIDHRYNCWPNYASPEAGTSWATDPLTGNQDIAGCTAGTPDHIYDLINSVGSSGSAGYTDWTTLGHPCDVPSSGPAIVVTSNVRVDCATLTVRKSATITGNVIFDGNVTVEGGTGSLTIDNTLATPGWAFFRNGTFSKAGQASLAINYTMVYVSKTSRVAMAGNSTGSLTWIAPDSGDFDDLALWSDSPLTHDWAGQANLTMEGVFFMPRATADYAGGGGQNQTDAQWVAYRLVARGGGQLEIRPAFGRSVEFPRLPQTVLIR
jgi:Flp pilus assembly protein TadG